jgi:xanthine dehydrogenase YagS FAD-binding subunit
MHSFAYESPRSTADALAALSAPNALPLGGGTDLLLTIKERLIHPDLLVDLRRIPNARAITTLADGTLRIGFAARIADIAVHPLIVGPFSALAQAAQLVGTPALRNMGTIGGNLGQRPRCWYFRRGVPCVKNGATGCPAIEGENQYHAILDAGPCHAVHPSDPAVALVALDAAVEITGTGGTLRTQPIAAFFAGASQNPLRETSLQHGEIISAILLPESAAGGTQQYTKLMQRGAWDFALVSIAAVKRTDGDVRLVLGGVAPGPYRVNPSVEQDVASGELDDESVEALAERALYDAEPLSKNAYKVQQAAALLKRSMHDLSRA